MSDNVTLRGLTDEMLQDRARSAVKYCRMSMRSVAEHLDVAPSSLHEAIHGPPTARLRKLRMRVVEFLEDETELTARTIIVEKNRDTSS